MALGPRFPLSTRMPRTRGPRGCGPFTLRSLRAVPGGGGVFRIVVPTGVAAGPPNHKTRFSGLCACCLTESGGAERHSTAACRPERLQAGEEGNRIVVLPRRLMPCCSGDPGCDPAEAGRCRCPTACRRRLTNRTDCRLEANGAEDKLGPFVSQVIPMKTWPTPGCSETRCL